MGSCVLSKHKVQQLTEDQISRYPRIVKISIRVKNPAGKVTGHNSVSIQLNNPISLSSKHLSLNNSKLWVSSCVLQNLDPSTQSKKPCQDFCFYTQNNSSVLMALFDGHGPEGEKISYYCSKFIENYYLNFFPTSDASPSEVLNFLKTLIEECDKELRLSDYNILYSGATCVVSLIYKNNIYSASVGDSRAVLGTTLAEKLEVSIPNNENKNLGEVKIRRSSKSNNLMQPLQLTKDHRPEDPEERERILAAGGRVERLLDYNGNRVGPYRVWESTAHSPGLTMSRSLGDMIGKQIGLISTPTCDKHFIDKDNDSFLVIASDGIWDVMDNEDVVNFVECFRNKCRHGTTKVGHFEVVPGNSCIAHLLCEESRTRWLTIVEDEDVHIDDISCIVLEFKKSEFGTQFIRKTENIETEPKVNLEGEEGTSMKEVFTRDPRRGSLVIDKIKIDKLEDS